MKNHITSAEARGFRRRWKTVNAAEREELINTPVMHKLLQLAALMASVKPMGWSEALAAEEAEVRDRWSRLRKALGE
jgi:hypothetical protein